MGKSSPSVPAAPDPAVTASAQTATNQQTALWNAMLNNVNQVTPYGNLTYTQNSAGTHGYDQAGYDTALAAYNAARPSINKNDYMITDGRGRPRVDNAAYRAALAARRADTSVAPKLDDFKTDTPPTFTSTISLSPESQQLLDTQMASQNALATLGQQQIGRISDAVATPYSYDGLPAAPTQGDINGLSQSAQDAIMSRLDPQFARDEESMRSRLINQGIGQGSQAYNTEMERFNQSKNDARQQAILNGASYGSTMQNQQLGLRNQAIQEYNAQRNAPLNEYTAMTSGQQVQNPSFQSTNYQGAAPADYAGAVQNQYQGQLNQYNAGVGQSNSMMSGLFGLGGSLLSGGTGAGSALGAIAGLFSDRELKKDISWVGVENGHNVYSFKYKNNDDKTYIGVMAQEVEQTRPDAVSTHENGYKMVNYDAIGVRMREA